MTTTTEPLLEVRNLSVAFETARGLVRAVDNVSFTIDRNEALGVLGESGSGKSVTSLAMLRLFGPMTRVRFAGEVWFGGQDLLKLSDRELRRVRGSEIGMVFQDPLTSLDPIMPVGMQITETLRYQKGMRRDAARRKAIELLDLVGIPDPQRQVDELPHRFSGGMRQRVVIAMAIACEPKLLIADEPTTALDVTVQAQVLKLLNDLQRDLGMAVMLVSHDLGVVAAVCDTVNVMYAGRLVERGEIRHILRSAHHPYTAGLIRLVPQLEQQLHGRLRPIEGVPLTVVGNWQGCRFAPRCPMVTDRCREDDPPMFDIGPAHVSACWLDEKDALTANASEELLMSSGREDRCEA